MYKLNRIIPNIVLTVLLAITVIVCLLFFLGGDIDPNAEYLEPIYTGTLLNFTYFLLGLTCIVAIISAIISFVTKLMSNPRSALVSFIGIGILALLLILTYALGDATPLNIAGYDGTQEPFYLKLTDMCLNTSYILLGIAIFVSLFGFLVKRI